MEDKRNYLIGLVMEANSAMDLLDISMEMDTMNLSLSHRMSMYGAIELRRRQILKAKESKVEEKPKS